MKQLNENSAKAILLGFTIPNETYQALIHSNDKSPSIQTHRFSHSFLRSLEEAGFAVTLISSCQAQNYPLNKKILFSAKKISISKSNGILLPHINLLVLKHLSRLIGSILTCLYYTLASKPAAIFIHGTHSPFLLAGIFCRAFGVKTICIITDPPGVAIQTDSKISRILKSIDKNLIKLLLRFFNGFIILAPSLKNLLSRSQISLLLPGIINPDIAKIFETTDSYQRNPDRLIVMYAGGLNIEYGVMLLINSVRSITEFPIELRLYGTGDLVPSIEAGQYGQNIKYLGNIGIEKLIIEYSKSDLLINPRPSSTYLGINSFPSKLFEYIMTGKPVLTTKLPSIPPEIKDCFYYIDSETSEGISNAIRNFHATDNAKTRTHVSNAKILLLKLYSVKAVSERLLNYVTSIK